MTTSLRTPREFSAAGIGVRLLCRCGHEKRVEPMEFEFTHGEDFDLSLGWVALSNEFRCEACGDRPVIALGEAQAEAVEFIVDRPSRRRVGER